PSPVRAEVRAGRRRSMWTNTRWLAAVVGLWSLLGVTLRSEQSRGNPETSPKLLVADISRNFGHGEPAGEGMPRGWAWIWKWFDLFEGEPDENQRLGSFDYGFTFRRIFRES